MRHSARPNFVHKRLFVLICLTCFATVAAASIRDDERDNSKSTAKSAPAAEAGLTERERMLLDRVEQLERRVAELEAARNSSSASLP